MTHFKYLTIGSTGRFILVMKHCLNVKHILGASLFGFHKIVASKLVHVTSWLPLSGSLLGICYWSNTYVSEHVFFVQFFSCFCFDPCFFCSPQSRSSRTSDRSTVGSRGGDSWRGPSTRLRPVAPVTPPAPAHPSMLPAPHQVQQATTVHNSRNHVIGLVCNMYWG